MYRSLFSKDLAKLRAHKKLFNIDDNNILSAFETFLSTTVQKYDHYFECSVKFENNTLFPVRFNVLYDYNKLEAVKQLGEVLSFFKSLEKENIKFDFSILKQTLKQMTKDDKLIQLYLGIDLRDKIEDSRLKVWLIFDINSNSFFDYLALPITKNKEMLSLVCNKNIVVGLDMFFCNKTKLKTYIWVSDFFNTRAMQKKISNLFDKALHPLFSLSYLVDIAHQNNTSSVIYFKTKTERFLHEINNKSLFSVYETAKQSSHFNIEDNFILGFSEEELVNKKITKFNLYY